MTPNEMLRVLSEHGEDADGDYSDGLEGWFGWQVMGDLLTATFQAGADDQLTTASWRLVPDLDTAAEAIDINWSNPIGPPGSTLSARSIVEHQWPRLPAALDELVRVREEEQ